MKTSGLEIRFEFLIPSSRCLFQTVECFPETKNMVGAIFINETRRLRDVNLISECSFKESVVDIQLPYVPLTPNRKFKN